ncbi:MAG: TatD family hydrolase [Spirochaetaceae bacterium]|nr:TatD family hydrolase [Spirochaetaceae bacterium]
MEFKIYPHTVDSHTHILEMEKKGLNVQEILQKCFDQGMKSALDAAVDELNFEKRLNYKKFFPGLFFSAGVHPSSTKNMEQQISLVEKQLQNVHVIAVGETGLDFHWDTVPADKQKEMFIYHIELSKKYKLPLIIHNRLADKEILEILKNEKADNGVIHCFSSNYHFAQKFIDLGFYISFAGNITYKKSQEIREAAAKIPFDRILVETDAPYLSPQKMRGKNNHPGNISFTIDCIADLFNKGADETSFQTYKNYMNLFQVDI